MHISLVLYAEHEFNASTFTSRVIAGTGSDMYSAIIGAIGALRGPKHGGRMKCRWRSSNATKRRTKPKQISASAWKTKKWSLVLVIRFTPSLTRATVIKRVAKQLSQEGGSLKMYNIADRPKQ